MTVRDKLREINVRLVELANYLNISRPTIYKYLESYENREYSKIDKTTFDLFSFIDTEIDLSKPTLMNYLIQKIVPANQLGGDHRLSSVIEEIRKLRSSQNLEDKKKFELIESILLDSKK
jgi:predicted transcriptional regulator